MLRIELLPFDLAALQDIGGQCSQYGFLAKVETEGLHVAREVALPMTNRSQKVSEARRIPTESRPVFELVNV